MARNSATSTRPESMFGRPQSRGFAASSLHLVRLGRRTNLPSYRVYAHMFVDDRVRVPAPSSSKRTYEVSTWVPNRGIRLLYLQPYYRPVFESQDDRIGVLLLAVFIADQHVPISFEPVLFSVVTSVWIGYGDYTWTGFHRRHSQGKFPRGGPIAGLC